MTAEAEEPRFTTRRPDLERSLVPEPPTRNRETRATEGRGGGSPYGPYPPEIWDEPPAPWPGCQAHGAAPAAETILVVEDERPVRDLIRDVLRLHGYVVLLASSGDEALAVSEHYPGVIHLMIVDVVMPGMSGEELVEKVAVSRPRIKAVYVSGYTRDLVRQHGLLTKSQDFLQKPFTLDDLARKVRQVLDRA